MSRAPQIALVVDGVEYRDIKRATVEQAIDQFADVVTVEMSDAWTSRTPMTWPFEEGDEFDFTVDGEIWVNGFVNSLPMSWSTSSGSAEHEVSMEGLSWGGNLTTSSHLQPRVWRDAKLDRIIRDVVTPYGLKLFVQPGVDLGEPFRRYAAGIGETAYEVMRRAAAKRGLWLSCGGNESDVEIVRTATERISHTIIGVPPRGRKSNALSASRTATFTDRHDEIIVVGQSGEHSDWLDDQATFGEASAHDYGVQMFRPLVIHEPSESGAKKLEERAKWEVRTRAGKSRKITFTVQGHLADGTLGPERWLVNRLVQAIDVKLDVDDELLIERLRTEFTTEGTTTTLELVAPEAYDQLAPPPKKRRQPRGRKGRFVSWG